MTRSLFKKSLLAAATLAASGLLFNSALAHQAYLAPLSHQVYGEHVLLHAGVTDYFFVPEHAIDAKFFAVSPQGQVSEVAHTHKLESTLIAEAQTKDAGSYYFYAISERASTLAQKDGKWLSVRDMPADKAPPADKRKFLLKSEVPAGAPTVDTKTINKLTTFVNKEQASGAAKLAQPQGFELAFSQSPAQQTAKDALSFTTLLDGKPVAGVELKLIETDKPLDDATKHSYSSDANGRVSIALPKAGAYLLTASHAPKPDADKPAPITYQYALSFIAK